MFQRIINYIKETRAELRQVSWPSKKDTINFTLIVIGVSIAVALLLGFFDMVFGYLLEKFIL